MAVGIYDWAWVLDRHDGLAHLVVRGDEAALARRLEWWQAQPEPAGEQDFVLNGPRITSYNVCYTKLLRAILDGQGDLVIGLVGRELVVLPGSGTG